MSILGSSIIRVSIIGDADKLVTALNQAEGRVGGLVGKLAKGFIALRVADKVVDVVNDGIEQYDRLGDATTRLESQIGGLSQKLVGTADDWTGLGLSMQDVLELEANFADLATATGLSDNAIASMAESVASTAGAVALLKELDPEAVVGLIGKAAGGSLKAAKELGVKLDANLNPSQQLASILAQLNPLLADATDGTADLGQKQSELQAKTETLSAKIGEAVDGPLNALLDFTLDEIDAIPGAIEGFQMLWKEVEKGGDAFDVVTDAVGKLYDAMNSLQTFFEGSGGGGAGGGFSVSEGAVNQAQQNWYNRNLQGSP